MTERAPPSRGSRVKAWLVRCAFFASVLALLGTSPARWHLEEPVKGPHAPPTPDHALRVTVEASDMPTLTYRSRSGAPVASQCVRLAGAKPTNVTCLLPPGASVDLVTLRGACTGGGGCRREAKPCEPPPGAFVHASSEIVGVWRKTVQTEARLSIPPRPSKGAAVARIDVVVEPDVPELEVVLRARTPADAPKGWDGAPTVVSCGPGFTPHPPGQTTCGFHGFFQDQSTHEVTVVAEVTRWGGCATAEACPPPLDADVRIVSLGVR